MVRTPPSPHVFPFLLAVVFSHLPASESPKLVSQDKEPLRSIPLRDIQKVHECLVKSGWVKREWLNLPPCCLVPTIALAKACVLNGGKSDYTQIRNKKCLHKLCTRLREVWSWWIKKKVIHSASWHDAPTCTGTVVAGPLVLSSSKFFEKSRHSPLLAWTPQNSLWALQWKEQTSLHGWSRI